MEGDNHTHKRGNGFCKSFSSLLELSAVDDLASFKRLVEEEGHDVDEPSSWYGRRIGSKNMGFEDRTPLMIAAMFGSKDVLSYILQTGLVNVNRACGSDGATALHFAAAGGSFESHEIIKLLIDASADINCVDANGSRPADVIAPCINTSSKLRRRILEFMLKGEVDQAFFGVDEAALQVSQVSSDGNGTEKKEYPIDPSLPDIKNGIYSTDEFRMYTFKVKPCSRAYSHDWTECPFVHPGENARRRDPRKYHYSCVPCPEFKKGCCSKGDNCEYGHGIFECWLHPAQYRTRLCKDETNCSRRVCFFAHKPEELRPLYASTGSAVPSPRSMSSFGASPFDMALPSSSTPPMTPTSPMGGGGAMWQNQLSTMAPPALQLPGSRLKTTFNARSVGLEAELLRLENQGHRQQLLEELAGLSPMSNGGWGRLGNDSFGSVEPRHNLNQHFRSSYSPGSPSSPVRASSPFGMDPSASAALLNSRSAAFAKRSQSFIDRGAPNRLSGFSSPNLTPSHLSNWGSPNGKLEWGIQGEELNKLRKSASFGIRNNTTPPSPSTLLHGDIAPGVSSIEPDQLSFEELKQRRQYHLNSGGSDTVPAWMEQLYMEQEQLVA